jgi:hypothetical protein
MVRIIGKNSVKRHLEGKKLGPLEAINGKCYDCMGQYADGRYDCRMPECTLYPFMPYRGIHEKDNKEEK